MLLQNAAVVPSESCGLNEESGILQLCYTGLLFR